MEDNKNKELHETENIYKRIYSRTYGTHNKRKIGLYIIFINIYFFFFTS